MIDPVRVRIVATGHHATISQAAYKADSGKYALLKGEATDVNGRPLPGKPRTQITGAPAPEATPATNTTEATKEAN